jgi:hypothetical protein
MIRKFHLISLVLVAAAVVAPIAQPSSTPKVDPLAVSYLTGMGLTPSEVTSWTTDACSHQVKATWCHEMFHTVVAPKPADPLAVGYLIGQGLSPSQVTSWTVGACSHRAKAPSCYAMIQGTAAPKPADPLAVGYLIGQGLSPSEVRSWTTGACSHKAKAASCYAMFKPAVAFSTPVSDSTGFQWGDAGIGAGFALGIVLLVGGAGAGLLISRRNGRRQAARA